MKKCSILLIIPASLVLLSCGKKQKSNDNNSKSNTETRIIEDEDVEDLKQHATSISATPNASFYLKVGDKKDVSVTLSPSPTDSSEKDFNWTTKSNCLSVNKDSKSPNKAVITALKEGSGSVLATNTYDESLKKYFNVNAIELDDENSYLWQYSTEDRKQFGYTTENKQGDPEGDAVLNGMTWHFFRSETTSLQSSAGSIGFGKGSAPEQQVKLVAQNNRLIDKIVVEACSSKGLADIKVKVGDVSVIDQKCADKDYNDIMTRISSNSSLSKLEGDISIEFDTPAYDSARAEDPSYTKPGAAYLKSILIYYAPEEATSIEVDGASEHKVNYFTNEIPTEEGLKLNKVSDRGVRMPINIDEELKAGRLKIIYPDFATPSHDAQNVTVKYTPEGSEQELVTTFPIHVRDDAWVPTITVIGTMKEQALIAGDDIDYSDLQIKATFTVDTDYILYPFVEDGTFSITCYDKSLEDCNPFIAEKVMESGFKVLIQGIARESWQGLYTVSGEGLTIQDAIYDRIELKKMVDELDINSTAKPLDYTTPSGRITIHFDGITKEKYYFNNDLKIPATSKEFTIKINDSTLCMDRLNVTFVKQSSILNKFNLSESYVGGKIYSDPVAEIENFKIAYNQFDEYTNAVKLAPGLTGTGNVSTNKIALGSILVRYVEHPHAEYSLSCGSTVPQKLTYNEGETFDPTGLQVMLACEAKSANIDVTQYVEWYDGATYATNPQKTLTPASTYVVGVFNGKTFNVDITAVNEQKISLSLVKSLDEITDDGHYYLVNRSAKLINLGSATDLKNGTGAAAPGSTKLNDVTFGETADLNILYKNDYFNIIKEEGKSTFVINGTNNHGWSVSGSGATSSTLEPKNGFRSFVIEIDPDTGVATFHMSGTTGSGTEVDKYLGASDTKFDLYAPSSDFIHNISIYKVN